MKHYFISKGKLNEGPYKYEELLEKGITPDTWIWYAGSKGWEKASNVEEFKDILPAAQEAVYTNRTFNATDLALPESEEGSIGELLLKGFSLIAVLIIILRLLQVI